MDASGVAEPVCNLQDAGRPQLQLQRVCGMSQGAGLLCIEWCGRLEGNAWLQGGC
jgi:hypothetical protein